MHILYSNYRAQLTIMPGQLVTSRRLLVSQLTALVFMVLLRHVFSGGLTAFAVMMNGDGDNDDDDHHHHCNDGHDDDDDGFW